jgi:2-dehydro-3-deoxy-D-gluconate 5-dehydrogenase
VPAAPVTDWGPFSLRGRNALITGGAQGIGHQIATRFLEAGATVMIADISARVAEAAAGLGPGAHSVRLDVTDPADCERAVASCVTELGSLDILVNNAGIYPGGPVLEMTPEFYDRVMGINLRGLAFMSKAAGRQMVAQGRGGKIVNLGSITSVHPSGLGVAIYSASKGGVLMFTKSFALEMAPHGVTVNALGPGGVRTETATGPREGIPPEVLEKAVASFTARVALGRRAEPDDIAKVAVFLASSAADYMTGAFVPVDGGYLLT